MTNTFRHLGLSELLPRYVFAENLFVRRRVLEVGAVAATDGQSAGFLAQRGARSVVACDRDLDAVGRAQKAVVHPAVRFRADLFDDLEAGSFDLVLVADLGPYTTAPALLKELCRLVAKGGYLIGGLRAPAGLALSQLMDPEDRDVPPTLGQVLDVLTPFFPSIEVATQAPVLGYQLAFERGEGLQVDGSLAPQSEAAYAVVVAGQTPPPAIDPIWVQLPPEPLAYAGGRLDDFSRRAHSADERVAHLKEALEKTKAEADQNQAKAAQLAEQLEQAREQAARATAQLETLRSRPSSERERDELTLRAKAAEQEASSLALRLEDAERRLSRQKEELEASSRAQKDMNAVVLAAQQAARLERTRREEAEGLVEKGRAELDDAFRRLTEQLDRERLARSQIEQLTVERDRSSVEAAKLEAQFSHALAREVELGEKLAAATAKLEAQSQAGPAEELLQSLAAEQEKTAAALAQVEELTLRLADPVPQEVKAQLSSLAEKLELSTALADDLGRQLEATKAEGQGLREQVQRLTAELEAVRLELAQATDERSRSRAQGEEASAALAAANLELTHLRADFAAVQNDLLKAESELSSARSRSGAERSELASQLEQARAEAAQKERQGEELASLRDRVQAAEAELAEVKGQLSDAAVKAAQVDEATSKLAEQQKELDAVKDDLVQAEVREQSLRHKVERLDSLIEQNRALEAKVAELEGGAQVKLLQRRLAAQETELSALRKAQGRAPSNQVQQIYERASAELTAVKAEIQRRVPASKPPKPNAVAAPPANAVAEGALLSGAPKAPHPLPATPPKPAAKSAAAPPAPKPGAAAAGAPPPLPPGAGVAASPARAAPRPLSDDDPTSEFDFSDIPIPAALQIDSASEEPKKGG